MKRGEVYWAVLAPRSGSEQAGRRPVIVVSRVAFNQAPGWRSVIVVPVSTSRSQARRGPTAIEIRGAGLTEGSVALCHQVTTLDRSKLEELIGALNPDELTQLEHGLIAAFGMG